ncbi:vasculin-like [Megalops cyprinoides]|uniref:vasculin-like n=1 Tax=Megalops cyprinoides TaxID=118141 RepID=UPI0018645C72|nr:vasculin-like [Megalops cyprinoides]
MAQHDFAPAWLNFPTPPSSAKPSLSCEKPPEAPVHLDNRRDVSRRRHNSSDSFESVNGRAGGGYLRKEKNGWRGRNGSESGSGSARAAFHSGGGSSSRSRPGGQPGGKSKVLHENNVGHNGSGKRDEADRRKQFEAEDFPSLNPDAERELNQNKAVAVGVWEHPPNPKSRTSKMMVIKRIPREEQSTALPSSALAQPVPPKNGTGPSFYKGLVPKPAAVPVKGSRSCSSSPVDKVSQPRLMMRLTRVRTDRKSQFLKALKQDKVDEEDLDDHCKDDEAFHVQNSNLGHGDENRNSFEHSAPRENGNAALVARQQILRSSTFPQPEVLSSSLEAEHRLLKEMGWQEESENDETCAPLTEDEMREFQAISEQLQKNGLRKNGLLKNGLPSDFLGAWRNSTFKSAAETEETETSSSDTSDDEA